jgi:N-acetylglucosaminyl-diphospho-decaprenol L-rhamnosyltransferase
LHWRFPIERIYNKAPKGFGANNNQAFSRCVTPWFLVVNPDMQFPSDVLAPLLAVAQPRSGLLTPRIYEPGRVEPEQHRRTITPLEILTRRRPHYPRPEKPDWIPGLFMLFRAEVFARIRGFDKRYFMYGEDFDICARMQLAGWQLEVDEALVAIHDARRASQRSIRHFLWHATSLWKVWTSRAFWQYRSVRAEVKPGHRSD